MTINDGGLKEYYKRIYVHQHIPFCFQRDDGELLFLNNDFESYSFHFSDVSYDPRALQNNHFNIVSWVPIDNLFNNPQKYFSEKFQLKINYRATLIK